MKAKKEAKKVITGLTFDDFMVQTNLSTPSKLELSINGKPTDHYLMYIGAQSEKVSAEKLAWGLTVNAGVEALKNKDLSADEVKAFTDSVQNAYDKFAMVLVSGWSFGKLIKKDLKRFFVEEKSRSVDIVNQAFDKDETLAKK